MLGIDTSHHNPLPDYALLRPAGFGFTFAKATEGTTFVDPQFAASRAGAHAAGIVFGGYHFARLGDPAAEASFFLSAAHPVAGEVTVLDLEVAVAGVDPVAWAARWSTVVKTVTGVAPLLYLNQSLLHGNDWRPVLAVGDGLYLAAYDYTTASVDAGQWPQITVKQYSDRATVPGESTPVDEDVLLGDLTRFQIPGAPMRLPAPPVHAGPAPFDVAAWRAKAGDDSDHVLHLQAWLNRTYPAYSRIGPLSTHYGPQTVAVLREWQARVGVKGGDGTNVGPQTAAALKAAGFRG